MAYDSVADTWSDGLPALGANQMNAAFAKRVAAAGGDVSATNALAAGTPTPRSLADKFGDHPTVFDFVVAADNTSDYGPAINRCLAAGYGCDIPTILPVATPLVFPLSSGLLFGRDRKKSGLQIAASTQATMAAAGAIMSAASVAVGPTIRDLGVFFEQPASGTSWVQYPPVLKLVSAARARLSSVRIELGWDGILATGSASAGGCGGLTIENLESSCLHDNVNLDQCFDTVRIVNPHIWLFGALADSGAPLHPNQAALFAQITNNAIGYTIGRVDDLIIDHGLTIMKNSMVFSASAASDAGAGAALGTISNHDFDTFGGLVSTGSNLLFSGCILTLGTSSATDSTAVVGNGAGDLLQFANCYFLIAEGFTSPNTSQALVFGSGSHADLTGCRFDIAMDVRALLIDGASTEVSVNSCKFNRAAAGTWTRPAVTYADGAVPHFVGNRHTIQTVATVPFLQIGSDAPGVVAANTFGNTVLKADPAFTQLVVSGNAGVASRSAA